MPYLIKSVTGHVLDNHQGEIIIASNVVGTMGMEDYIEIHGLIAFTQNFSKVVEATTIQRGIPMGIKGNRTIIELEISY